MSSHQALEICIKYISVLTEILCPPVPKFIISSSEKRSSLIDKTCGFKVVEISLISFFHLLFIPRYSPHVYFVY